MKDRVTLLLRRPILLILVFSVLLRLGSAFYQGDEITSMPGVHDQISYDALARRVATGEGFSFAKDWWPATRATEPTAHWSFLYTLYLAATYLLFGFHPIAARLIQALIAGFLQPWLVWRIARRFFSERTAAVAALLVSFYAYFIFYSGTLMTETFYILGILWSIDVACRLRQRAGASSPVEGVLTDKLRKVTRDTKWILYTELGIAIGITVLLRQVFLLFVPILLGWIIWQTRPQPVQLRPLASLRKERFLGPLLSMVILLLMMAPWTVRNYQAFENFVLLNTNAGFAFFWGNHPIHGSQFVPILPTSYGELIPDELRPLNEAELDRSLLKRGIEIVLGDPLRYGVLSVSRLKEYFRFWPSGDSGLLSNVARVASFGFCLPFVLLGMWVRLRKDWDAGLLLLLAFAIFYTTIHILTWSLIRYRLPIDSILLMFAAVGVVTVWDGVRVLRGDSNREFLVPSSWFHGCLFENEIKEER